MEGRMTKRLQKDLEAMQKNYKDVFNVQLPTNDLKLWHIEFTLPEETIFKGETYKYFYLYHKINRLQFKFSAEYPIESPEVLFIGKTPDHEHIYSNGFICMSILYDEWSAALTVASICLSLISMLSSATKKSRPFNDQEFCKRSQGRGPKAFLWSYDDEKC